MYILILQSRVNQNQSSQNLPLHIQPLQSSNIQMLERLVGGQVTLSYSSGDMTLEQIERQAGDVKKSATLSDCLPIGQRFNNLVTPSN